MSWEYRLPYSKDLRAAIDDGDLENLKDYLKLSILWVAANVADVVSSDYDDLIEDLDLLDIDEDDDVEEQLDYILSEFYDLCDVYRVWIDI